MFTSIHADVSFVNASDELDIEAFKNWRPEYKDAEFVLKKMENTLLVAKLKKCRNLNTML